MNRSAIMRAVKSRDTSPELVVRRIAYAIAIGYRLHRKDLPGKPDLAYGGRRKAIFVHGCFWHGHNCARGVRVPKTNRAYWLEKIARNRTRDQRNKRSLLRAGWRSLTIWECDLKNPEQVTARLRRFLT